MNKLLPPFAMPLLVGLGLVLVGLVTKKRAWSVVGVGLIWLASTPLVGGVALRMIEAGYVRTLESDAIAADLVVVLSSGRHLAPGPARVSEWGDADRFFAGVDLWTFGKAPRLVFTDATPSPSEPNQGELLAGIAVRLGVAQAAIDVVGPVRTTEDEADVVACAVASGAIPLVGATPDRPPTILLVTSALHMPRAQRVFERRGFVVVPFAVDFRSEEPSIKFESFVPSSGALRQTELAWREVIGRVWERIVVARSNPVCRL
jgi:uncharacterized SAM-binding protein YcdF (DUF218 family)